VTAAEMSTFNALDIGIAIALVIGLLVGLALGFIRAGLFAMSWVGATAATVYGFPYAQPFARGWIETQLFADLAAGVAIFVVVLVVLFVISSLIGDWVRASRLNAVDRSLGALAGLAATALLVVVAYVAAASVWPPDDRPKWFKEARAMTIVKPAAGMLMAMIPEALANFRSKRKAPPSKGTTRVIQELEPPKPKAPEPTKPPAGYDQKQRQQMERLHDSIQRQ